MPFLPQALLDDIHRSTPLSKEQEEMLRPPLAAQPEPGGIAKGFADWFRGGGGLSPVSTPTLSSHEMMSDEEPSACAIS